MIVIVLIVTIAGLFGIISLLTKNNIQLKADLDESEQVVDELEKKMIVAHQLTLVRRDVTMRLQNQNHVLHLAIIAERHIHEEELNAAHRCLEMVLEENPSDLKYFSADIGLRDGIVWKKTTIRKLDRQGAVIHDQRRPHLRSRDSSGLPSGSSHRSGGGPQCQHLGAEDGGG